MSRLNAEISFASAGSRLMCRALLIQLVITFARASSQYDGKAPLVADLRDEKNALILRYINENLTEELTVDFLAERFYVSKYHMMRSFKKNTGFSIHEYISEKRLLLSRDLLEAGFSATDACYGSGFHNYSTYARAYKKLFGAPPGKGVTHIMPPDAGTGD